MLKQPKSIPAPETATTQPAVPPPNSETAATASAVSSEASLQAPPTEPKPTTAAQKPAAKKTTLKKQSSPKPRAKSRPHKKKAQSATSASPAPSSGPRADSKGAKILKLIARPNGATLGEIRKASGWQAHSVRGFLSVAAHKYSLPIQSAKNQAGDRVYLLKG